MSRISAEQVQTYRGGNYTTLEDFLNRAIAKILPFKSTQVFTLASPANFVLVDNSFLPGNIAKGATSTTNQGGIIAAALAGVVGTASASAMVTDTVGEVISLIEIRDSVTNDPVEVAGKQVFGLVQCSASAADGAAIAASGSENLQISFVQFDSSDSLVLVSIPAATYEFQVNALYASRYLPTLMKEGGAVQQDFIDFSLAIRRLAVTTEFPAGDVINITTGAGGTGVATASGASIVLPAVAGTFNSDGRILIYRNGQYQDKGTDVIWDSSNSFHFALALRVAEVVHIVAP